MKKVISKNINTIHYDPKSKVLEVSFNDGTKYNYQNVPEASYKSFENAKSHGKHFIDHIKGKYITKKQ
jgi:KTSC domain